MPCGITLAIKVMRLNQIKVEINQDSELLIEWPIDLQGLHYIFKGLFCALRKKKLRTTFHVNYRGLNYFETKHVIY